MDRSAFALIRGLHSAVFMRMSLVLISVCLLGGVLADRAGFGSAYLTGAILIAIVISVQAVIHRRHPVPGAA